MGLLDAIQAKIQFLRLERRYARSRRQRSTFHSDAVYVDGEYIYQTPVSTGATPGVDALHQLRPPRQRPSEAKRALFLSIGWR